MKIILRISLVIALLLGGYVLGSFFPFTGFLRTDNGIEGNAELKITVLRPDNSPASNLEVDIAVEPGTPRPGGIEKTDSKGVATFHIKPGTYYIFFNANNFPKDLLSKKEIQVTVVENETTNQTINLFPIGK